MLDLALQRLSLSGYARARVMRPSDGMTRRPRVSVVVPCYNYGRFLEACVGSILEQPDVDVDVLIVDDASPDGSGDVAEAIAARDPRVRVHRNATNQGHIATYNIGFAQIDGEYVLLLSADDMLTPGALSRAAALMESHPSVGFVYGWSIDFSDEPPPARTRTRSWSVWSGMDWLEDNCRRATNVIRSSDALVRRSLIEQVGGYREDLPHSGDHEWWMRAAQAADVGMVSGVDQLYYRLHGTNMSRTEFASAVVNLHKTRQAFDAALDGSVGGDPQTLAELRRTAYRSLARKALWLAAWEYMTGPEGAVDPAAYREFAMTVDPDISRSRSWRALERREAAGVDRARRTLSFRAREVVRDLEGRVSWHRRRFSGV
ncbi:MAG TPA: glycosyltransferase [Solirubrobacteraceae bacterium]|nr:glycosyltransferase [Solirubrobacteraceae bacterium]